MVVCLSVVKHLILTPLLFKVFNTRLRPSASIALEDETSVTWTTEKSRILLVLSSITVYVPYFALCPGLSHRPSQISIFFYFFTSSNRCAKEFIF